MSLSIDEPVCHGSAIKCSFVRSLTFGLLALAAMSITPNPPEMNHAAIPFLNSAAAGQQYPGDGLSITRSADGAYLHCGFQKIDGCATEEGLWLVSTAGASNSAPFRVIAKSVGREHGVPTPLPKVGEMRANSQKVKFHRIGVDEDYTVSVEGVEEDFLVTSRPAGNGGLRVELAVDGACAEGTPGGARLTPVGSARTVAYHRLRVTDAQGHKLPAHLDILSSACLAVVVDDAGAVYPIRIDPTFSDANWVNFFGLPGANGNINATVVDANGNLYVGGIFSVCGTITTTGVAEWNGTAWSALGGGFNINGVVNALAFDKSGNLYAGGDFTNAGGMEATNIAEWNGSAWSAVG